MNQQEVAHQQQLSRARADRRVLHRNSRDFLESKHVVEKQRDALEGQLVAAEEQKSALRAVAGLALCDLASPHGAA